MAEAIRVSGPVSGTEKTLTFETGRFALQIAGSRRWSRIGRSSVLATANAASSVREGIDFFPLTVDVEERSYAAGKIPGSFFRREGRPTEDAILTCRLTDRPLRPSFAEGLPQRDPGRDHGHRRRPGEPPRHARHQRRLGGAHDLGHPLRRARSAPSAWPTARTAPGSRTRPTTRVTRAPSSWSWPGASWTTATSPS